MWEVITMCKANNIKDLMNVFQPFPLSGENFNAFYVDMKDVREDVAGKIALRLENGKSVYAKTLFSGHMGCGKSTELFRIKENIKDKYHVISVNISTDLDQNNLSYIDIIFAAMNNIITYINENEICNLEEDLWDSLYSYWNSESFKETLTENLFSDSTEILAGGTMSVGSKIIPKFKFLLDLAVKGQAMFKTTESTKTLMREKIEPKLSDFIKAINDTILKINSSIAPKELLLLIEDLDKLDTEMAKKIFVTHRKALLSLNIKAILMIPIYIVYTFDYHSIKDDFDATYVLDMINLYLSDRKRNEKGFSVVRDVIYKRAEENLFEDGVCDFLIEKSGGVLRDLFHMISEASLNTMLEDNNASKVTLNAAKKAYGTLKVEYRRNIETDEHYARLIEIYNNPKPRKEDRILMDLLKCTAIIEYNSAEYCFVHPVLQDYLRECGDID